MTDPAPAPAPAVAEAPATPSNITLENWKDILPADTREWDRVQQAKTPKDLMDSFGYFMNKAGKSLAIPGENATDEQRSEFLGKLRAQVPELLDMPMMDDVEGVAELFTRLGKPEDTTGYQTPEFDLVDGVTVNNDQLDAFKTIAHKYNLTKAQFNGIMKD